MATSELPVAEPATEPSPAMELVASLKAPTRSPTSGARLPVVAVPLPVKPPVMKSVLRIETILRAGTY